MKNLFKKTMAAILTVSILLCSFGIFAFAADSNGLEEAIISVKSRIVIPEELCEFDSNIRKIDETTYYWLSWNDKSYGCSVHITVNDKGDICEYYKSDGEYDDTVKFPAYSGEELKAMALKWLEGVNPEWVSQLDLNDYSEPFENIYSDSESISFNRVKNGIRFLGNFVSIGLNNRTGEITNMYSDWSYDGDIPDTAEAMDITSAGDEFFKLSPLELVYETDDDTATLVYSPKNAYVSINARKGGEITDEYGVYNKNSAADAATEEAAMSAGGASANRLTESEIANLAEIEGLLSEKDLIAKARSLKNTGLDKAEYDGCQYTRGYGYYPKSEDEEKPEYFARLTFKFNTGTNEQYNASVSFDAKTGELVGYNAYHYNDKASANVSAEDAVKKAKEFINEYCKNQADKVKLDEMPSDSYGFNFTRYENDIPYYANSISVDINSKTGYIEGLYKNWNEDIAFESPDGVMDMTAAEKKFRQNIGFELSYVYDYKPTETGEGVSKVVELCYTLNDTNGDTINARTGEPVRRYPEQETVLPEDISGHYAEDEIIKLVQSGVIEIDEETPKYRPDDVITKGELGYLASRVTYRYYPYEPAEAESRMRQLEILLPEEVFSADEAALREDGPMYLLRAMGYREIAELADIYKAGFADSVNIPSEKMGYVAIAKGLKIINGDENNCFNAGVPLTRADAAIMIYNYLAR